MSHDHHVLAVPLDNRQIRLYDLGGNRLAILPYRKRKVCVLDTVCLHVNHLLK